MLRSARRTTATPTYPKYCRSRSRSIALYPRLLYVEDPDQGGELYGTRTTWAP